MYYKPGTAMGRLCPRGHDLMVEYCQKNKVPYELCGKLIVASEQSQVPTIEEVYKNGVTNGVKGMTILRSQEEIHQKEPHVRGVAAVWSPQTGITDFAAVCRHMFKQLTANPKLFNYQFRYEAQDFVGVKTPSEELVLIRGRESGHLGPEKTVLAKNVITCCGLCNDEVAAKSGTVFERVGKRIAQTYSFRGRYYELIPEKRSIITSHVYPCPDYRKGMSVGVHFTPTINEGRGRQVIIGPGSALAFAREGYNSYMIDIEYCLNCAFSKGGWVSLFSNMNMIFQMYYMDISRALFLSEAQKLIPEVKASDIEDSFCGVQAIGIDDAGMLAKDLSMEFARPRTTINAELNKNCEVIVGRTALEGVKPLILNVRNAPSPAATACMSIAEDIVKVAGDRFKW
ncbi:2-hydroxyglutarate dehydrogenase [Strigomonas culicis]|nr:2-hydroxyglutarate dehydrogenase [Strigomonas culicis]|eukprot:EPY23767.1 2-hydroxyglutarate dehydrogenase [Strigomonas culicis]